MNAYDKTCTELCMRACTCSFCNQVGCLRYQVLTCIHMACHNNHVAPRSHPGKLLKKTTIIQTIVECLVVYTLYSLKSVSNSNLSNIK